MLDAPLARLQRQLEEETQTPPFTAIRRRRRRRLGRVAVTGAAVLVLVVLAGSVALTGGWPRSRSIPVGPAATSSARGPWGPATLAQLAASPSGQLFALATSCGDCAVAPAGAPNILYTSRDNGATWTTVGAVAAGWIYPTRTALWAEANDYASVSTDGGRTWRRWPLPYSQTTGVVAVGGDTVWILHNNELWTAHGAEPPRSSGKLPVAMQQGGHEMLPMNATTMIMMQTMDAADGYLTTDAGAHWTPLANPCARQAIHRWSALALAPDGSRWAICSTPLQDGAHAIVLVSTDSGRTWQDRGAAPPIAYAYWLYPFSDRVAWLTGSDFRPPDLYRTADGTHWLDVAKPGPFVVQMFVATGPDTAVMVPSRSDVLKTTTDGGHTWVSHRLPGDR